MRKALFGFVVVAMVALCAFIAFDSFRKLSTLPSTPDHIDIAGIGAPSAWAEVTAGVKHCELQHWDDKRALVPFTVSSDGSDATLFVELDAQTLCSTLQLPLRGSVQARADAAAFLPGSAPFVMTLDDNVPGSTRTTGLVSSGLLAAGIAYSLSRMRKALQARASARDNVGGTMSAAVVPGSAGALNAIAHNLQVSGTDSFFPPGPLKLCDAAESRSRRARTVGAPMLVVLAAAAAALGVWVAVDIVQSRYVWSHGVEVPAELKGETTRYQGVFVSTTLAIAYADPSAPQRMLSTSETFGTWFVGPDEATSAVRALSASPAHVVSQARADSWPWRVPTPLLLLALTVASVLGARSTWKNAGRLAAIAQDPHEVFATVVKVTENRVNGTTTGFTVKVHVDDTGPGSFTLAASRPPDGLIMAPDRRVLLVRAKDRPTWIEPVYADNWPFELSSAQQARFVAVVAARTVTTSAS